MQEAQEAFEAAQGSHNPNRIMELLETNPYHIDSLFALFELYR